MELFPATGLSRSSLHVLSSSTAHESTRSASGSTSVTRDPHGRLPTLSTSIREDSTTSTYPAQYCPNRSARGRQHPTCPRITPSPTEADECTHRTRETSPTDRQQGSIRHITSERIEVQCTHPCRPRIDLRDPLRPSRARRHRRIRNADGRRWRTRDRGPRRISWSTWIAKPRVTYPWDSTTSSDDQNLCPPTQTSINHPRNSPAADRSRLWISDRAGRQRPQFPRDLVLRLVRYRSNLAASRNLSRHRRRISRSHARHPARTVARGYPR